MKVCSGKEEDGYAMTHFSFKRPKSILNEVKKLCLPMVYLLKRLMQKAIFDISCQTGYSSNIKNDSAEMVRIWDAVFDLYKLRFFLGYWADTPSQRDALSKYDEYYT